MAPTLERRVIAFFRAFSRPLGAIAQLGERLVRNEEVGGSIPPGSTTRLRQGFGEQGPRKRVSAEALAKADSRVGWQAACIKSQRVRCVAKRRRLPGVARRAKTGGANMRYVYLLESIDFPNQSYVGLADDLRARLA